MLKELNEIRAERPGLADRLAEAHGDLTELLH
jgi:hypothetical protein